MAGSRGAAPARRPDASADRVVTRYPVEHLWDEITFLAYHLHWELATLLDLEHDDRRRLVNAVAELNERALEQIRDRL